MARVFFQYVKNKRILVMDISNLKNARESEKVIGECEDMIERLPLKSVLLMTDVTDSSYDMIGIERLKTFSRNTTPFVLASAVAGAIDEKKMVIEILERISGRKIMPFDSAEDTLDYLSSF